MYSTQRESKATQLAIKPVKMATDSTKGMGKVRPPLHNTGCFFYLLIAPPGAGKTTTLYNLLTQKHMFGKKFEHVHYFSPSLATVEIPLPRDRLHDELNVKELDALMKNVPKGERILFVFDDMVSQFPTGQKLMPFVRMIYNRRHITGKGGGCAIMMVSQKLTGIPRMLRCAADGIFYWRTANQKEIKTFYDEYVSMDYDEFLKLLDFAWSEQHSFLFARLDKREEERWFRNFTKIKMLQR